MKREMVGRPVVVSDYLVQSVDQKICESRRLKYQNFHVIFHKFHALFSTRLLQLGQAITRLAQDWFENAHGCAQNPENGFGFDFFLEQYHKDGDVFLNHIALVTDDETRVSFVNAETQEQSKQWLHTHSPNKPKSFKKRCLLSRKLMATVFLDMNEVLMVESMQRRTTIGVECRHPVYS
jgi:hypothetical protein